MENQIGIKEENLKAVADSLNQLLADEFVLYVKTRKAHWNVEGIDFYNKHLFFESQYRELDEIIDDVAERIRILGHFPIASLQGFLDLTHLSEKSNSGNSSADFIKELLADHDSILKFLRENIDRFAQTLKDIGTSDYATGLLEKHEKMAWMLRSHLAR